jgi:hypothetical protein
MLIVGLHSKVGNVSQFLWLGKSFRPSGLPIEPFWANFLRGPTPLLSPPILDLQRELDEEVGVGHFMTNLVQNYLIMKLWDIWVQRSEDNFSLGYQQFFMAWLTDFT